MAVSAYKSVIKANRRFMTSPMVKSPGNWCKIRPNAEAIRIIVISDTCEKPTSMPGKEPCRLPGRTVCLLDAHVPPSKKQFPGEWNAFPGEFKRQDRN